MQFRHGDLLIEYVDNIPKGAKKRPDNVLAEGETTGHAHRLIGSGSVVLEADGQMYMRVKGSATVVHEEHAAIVLPAGDYVVYRQREYDPYEKAARGVND